MAQETIRKVYERSPTLDTIEMVEKTIEEYSGEFRKTQIWEKLPRKVMWPTFVRILGYLQEINKIIISDDGIITYIWNPSLAQKIRARKSKHEIVNFCQFSKKTTKSQEKCNSLTTFINIQDDKKA